MEIRFLSGRSRHGWVVLATILALFAGACKKTNGSGPSEQTLKAYFSSSSRYTLFNRALEKTHLDSLLGGTNPYTVFAVDDSAMSRAGYTAAGIDSADIRVLRGILLYNMVPGAFDSSDVEHYMEVALTTADSNYQAFLEYNNFGLFYNGIPLVSVGNRLVNGLVHGIQTMARPPMGDLVATMANTPGLRDFSYVVRATAANLINLGGSYNNIIPYISGTPAAPITIFVPDDAFFASMGLDSYTAILQQQGAGPQLYMTQGNLFTSDFMGENEVNEYLGTWTGGNQLWFSADGSNFVSASISGNVFLSKRDRIVRSNIVATNGIIHVIEPY